MCDNPKNVSNPYYSINSGKNFFGGSDPIRIVIIIYIFLSLILNSTIFASIGYTIYKTKKKFILATWIMLSVLLMNFIHTFTYFFEWVIQNEKEIESQLVSINNNYKVPVGGLLVGNPKNIIGCSIQGFLLIFTSISQDFLINIFFYLVNSTKVKEKDIIIFALLLGVGFPFIFTLILLIVGGIGINDEFCYVKKFEYRFIKRNGIECVEYNYYNGFQFFVIIVYVIRVVNFFATIYFLKRIWSFVRKNQKPIIYLFKSIFIPIIQLVTVFIGVFYRFVNLIDPETSANFSGFYLIFNTVDGVLFPIGFLFQNNLISYLRKLVKEDKEGKLIAKKDDTYDD